MDTNTVIEGTVKFRDGKKWKSRWCVVRKLSPVADCVHLQLYRDSKERYKQGQTKASLSLENFLGIQCGFTLDKESNTLAIVCQEVVVILAFDTREHLMQWQVKISANLGEGDQFLVQISSAPPRAKLSAGPARLLIQEYQFCLTVGVPPRLIAFWQIRQLRRFGVVEGKFCFEGGSHCGRGEGLYVLVTEKPDELAKAFHLAAEGKLFTRKRAITRNMSVMDKARKHLTYRPDSRLSDVSSLESVLESPQGCDGARSHCCGCSRSREDLMSWPQSPSIDRGDAVSTTDSLRYDLKSLWNTDIVMGRCTSCMSKIGSMSRSSTMTTTPCSRFPVWTMDRPKSCGSQKISPSVTCSSMSLSSHSSKGSSCSNAEHHCRTSPVDNCSSACPSNGSVHSSVCTNSHNLPARPPKPPHLSFFRLQSTPCSELASSPSPVVTPVKSPTCFCNHQVPSVNSPYGNYDIPKPINIDKQNLKLDLKESTVNLRPQSQSSSEEYYDTPRRLKDCLVWEYGNYDIPPPAQPVSPSSALNTTQGVGFSTPGRKTESNTTQNEPESKFSTEKTFGETCHFPINKVKLTGEGRMPVMSPCGKIIENTDATYEEKLERLLENENLMVEMTSATCNYENVETNNGFDQEGGSMPDKKETSNVCDDPNQNYSNISVVQSLENYENFEYFFAEKCKTLDTNLLTKDHQNNNSDSKIDNKNEQAEVERNMESTCCSNCGHVCTKLQTSKESISHQKSKFGCKLENNKDNSPAVIKQSMSSPLLGTKCNSTSCLHEIKLDSINGEDQNISILNSGARPFLHCSVSASNSPSLKRLTREIPIAHSITSKMQQLCLRQRSNSADSARICLEGESVNGTPLTDSRGKCVLSNPSSTSSMCTTGNQDGLIKGDSIQNSNVNKSELKLAPLVITELSDQQEQLSSNVSVRYSDFIGAKRSSSVPNKFFSNRDSSSSNDSGVSTGSLSLRHCGTDFFEFEMPLTTSMSSKRHYLAMMNNASSNNYNEVNHKMLQKRSKSVDPLRSLTFTFGSEELSTGKSTSAEAEVPIFLHENNNKDYVRSQTKAFLSDSRSTSSGTSDMSDYYETLSFSSFSSLDAASDNFRYGRTSAPTMKPRSGKEYQKIDRNILDQETK